MCLKVGQIIPVDYMIVREFGNGALLSMSGNPGNDAVLFPDKKVQPCDTAMGVWYYEKKNILFVYGIQIPLVPGYEQVVRDRRNLKAEGKNYTICVKLLRQTPEQKSEGIYQANLESMTL